MAAVNIGRQLFLLALVRDRRITSTVREGQPPVFMLDDVPMVGPRLRDLEVMIRRGEIVPDGAPVNQVQSYRPREV